MNCSTLLRRFLFLSIAAVASSVPAYAGWGAFGAAVNKGQTGTCTYTVSGVTRTGRVQILENWIFLDCCGWIAWDFVQGKNTTSSHSANLGLFYVDTGIAGPWNFFYDQVGGLAAGGLFNGSHAGGLNKLAAAQCRVGNGSL